MLTLREYQVEDVGRIRGAMRRVRRILYVAPTGSGKGTAIAWMARRAASKGVPTIIGVHRGELVDDLSGRLRAVGVPHEVLAAGARIPRALTIVASIPTLARRLDYWRGHAKLVIVDEAHHVLPENQWGRSIAAFDKAHVVGFTASPARLDGRGLGDSFDEMIVGPSVKQLVAAGYLSQFRMFTSPRGAPDLSGIRTLMGDWDTKALADAMAGPRIVGDAVREYRDKLAGRPAVAFCVSVRHAELVAEQFRADGWRAVSVDGETPREERRRRIFGLADGSVQVLTSAELISEGLDIPGIQGAILLRPTQSLVVYTQQVGRALRPKADATPAIVLDHAGNHARFGRPDHPRQWSLTSEKRAPGSGAKQAVPIRTCLECYGVSEAGAPRCELCGKPFPVKARRLTEDRSVALTEAGEGSGPAPKITMSKAEIGAAVRSCATFSQVQALGQRLGYKPGWAWHAWNHMKGGGAPVSRDRFDFEMRARRM